VDRPVSYSRNDVADTQLAKIAAASMASEAGEERSGFRLLPDGAEAFAARMALIRRAEKTLDVQYYVIASDATGREFLRELQIAAARGVRVRILVDDLYATGQDELFAGLAAHDNVEVRMFNPLPVRGGSFAQRIFLSLHQFSRINHRMHNKLFIADGSFAVTGGRNIADEYFDRGGDANFIDMDLLSSGPVVARLAAVFDRFWNSEVAYPVGSLARQAPSKAAFERQIEGRSVVSAAGPDSLEAQLDGGRIELESATAEVVADAPQKASGDTVSPTVAEAHVALLGSARRTVLIASPYFVPGAATRDALATLRSRDVEVSVLTNSLATTDEPLVHYGYANHRAALLTSGVELHELMPSAEVVGEEHAALLGGTSGGSSGGSSSLGRLHTKLTVVDDDRTFVGSMNMDARSARLNTEAGMVIHSAHLARLVAKFLHARQELASYKVQQQGDRLSWLSGQGEAQRTRSAEPKAPSAPALPIRLLAQMMGEAIL
jgi:cardiolipin synthase C